MSEDFAFTVKVINFKTLGIPTVKTYQPIFNLWKKKKCIIETIQYEDDSKGILHAHGIIRIPKKVFRKDLAYNGITTKLKLIFDREGWIEYIKKDQQRTFIKGMEHDPDDVSSDDTIISIEPEDPIQCCLPKLHKNLFLNI